MKSKADHIRQVIAPELSRLVSHDLYGVLGSPENIGIFMQHHVFAVWDFMSLVKALQVKLTCCQLPWVAPDNEFVARFINEIVLSEETDIDVNGNYRSHFQMYISAMEEIGVDTAAIDRFIHLIKEGWEVNDAAKECQLPFAVQQFLEFTFACISSDKTHVIAAAFTFGREDVIPEMFLKILDGQKDLKADQLRYYLERHIELDGDEHGPMAIKLLDACCDNDDQKWQEVITTAKAALQTRLRLWDGAVEAIRKGSCSRA